MHSIPRKLTQLTLVFTSILCLAGTALAQTTVQVTSDPVRIDYGTTPGMADPTPFGPTLTATQTVNGVTSAYTGTLNATAFQTNPFTQVTWLSVSQQPFLLAQAGKYGIGIKVTPSLLNTPGTYDGHVDITTPNGTVVGSIAVTLIISAASNLTVNPTGLTFGYQAGGIVPASQVINIQPNGTSYSFTTAVLTSSSNNPACGNFLQSATTASGVTAGTTSSSTPTPINVTLNPIVLQSIPAGTTVNCSGTVRISAASAANGFVDVPVTLAVSNAPGVTFSTQSITLNAPPNSTVSQVLFLANPGAGLPYTVTVTQPTGLNNVLTVTPAGTTTPGAVVVTANTANLPAGSYSGSIQVTVNGAFNTTTTIPVTINVSPSAQVMATPSVVNLAYQTGSAVAPASQIVSLNATTGNAQIPFQVSVLGGQVNGQSFFQVSPSSGTTPSNITITPVTSVIQTLSPGTYTGTVQVTYNTQASPLAPLQIPVVLTVTQNAQLIVNPGALNFAQSGDRALTLGTTGTSLTYNIAVTQPANAPSGVNLITVGPTAGTIPTNGQVSPTVSVNTQGLAQGTYTGALTITSSAANNPMVVPITITVNTPVDLLISPTSLQFQVAAGATSAAQNVTLTGVNATLNYSIAGDFTTTANSVAACSGIQVNAVNSAGSNQGLATPSGNTVAISVTNMANIPIGTTCNGNLVVSYSTTLAGGSNVTGTKQIPVQVIVGSAGTLVLSNTSPLSFTFNPGGSAPQAQRITITSTGTNVPLTATATVTSPTGGNWLLVSLDNPQTPATLTISVNPANLAPGTYTGTVMVAAPSTTGISPLSIPVTLTVSAVATGAIIDIRNSASGVGGTVSPGELVSIYGANLGPTTGVGLTAASVVNGSFPTTLGGVTVTFDGTPAPINYASAGQINVSVPYEVAGRASTTVQVSYNGVLSNSLVYLVSNTAPGLFTAASSGTGPLAALNQDGSANTASNPATRGTVIVLYGTGEGQTTPASATGKITSGPTLPRPVQPVSLKIGGIAANIQYAGEAPGLVSGVIQINAVIPQSATLNPDGTLNVELTIGGVTTTQTVTIYAK